MNPYRRILEVEVLEDRCTPAAVAPQAVDTSNFAAVQSASTAVLPNGLTNSTAPMLVGPNGDLSRSSILVAGQSSSLVGAGDALPQLPVTGIGALGSNPLGILAANGLLLTNLAGVPSTSSFPLAGYFQGLPTYDSAIDAPDNLNFESLSPFVTNGMGRSSYEGSDGAGMATASAPNSNSPVSTPAPVIPYLTLDLDYQAELI